MANDIRCCLCRAAAGEESDILAMGRYGTPRYLCAECSGKIENATLAKDYESAALAIEALGEMLLEVGADDAVVKDALLPIIESAAERAASIKAGEYDFSLDEREDFEDEISSLPEELCETEEDRALDEADAEREKKIDKIINIAMISAFAIAAIVFILLKFF